MTPDAALLAVENLSVVFPTRRGLVRAVEGISYTLARGQTLGVVGESGCGKSVAALALLGLVDPPGQITGGTIRFDGTDLRTLDEPALESVRGKRIAMVFQEPMTALNPVLTIGDQVAEPLVVHENMAPGDALARAIDMLARVGIPDAARRAGDYPHQLSGGLRQRAMIAMALICGPDLLLADEPTTALDVTIQAQILDLIRDMQAELGMAVQLISHDLGVLSEVADTIAVVYAGRIVERAPATELFASPRHPYTQGLLATAPRIGAGRRRLPTIAGTVPNPARLPSGCAFHDRCPQAVALCAAETPALKQVGIEHSAACHLVAP